MSKKTVCVDLDGVLAQYDGWKGIEHIGDPIPGAQEFVAELTKNFEVWIHTTRCNPKIDERDIDIVINVIHDWLKKHNFVYNRIWVGEGKPKAIAYIDDRAVSCRPQENENAFRDALVVVERLND